MVPSVDIFCEHQQPASFQKLASADQVKRLPSREFRAKMKQDVQEAPKEKDLQNLVSEMKLASADQVKRLPSKEFRDRRKQDVEVHEAPKEKEELRNVISEMHAKALLKTANSFQEQLKGNFIFKDIASQIGQNNGTISHGAAELHGHDDITTAAALIVQKMHLIASNGSAPQGADTIGNAIRDISENAMAILIFAKIVAERCMDQKKLGPNLRRSIEPIESLCTQLKVLSGGVKQGGGEGTAAGECAGDAICKVTSNLALSVVNTLASAEACCLKGLDFDGCKMSKNEKSAKNIAEGWKTKLDAQRKESSQLKQKDVNEKGLRRNASEDAAKETRVNEYLE